MLAVLGPNQSPPKTVVVLSPVDGTVTRHEYEQRHVTPVVITAHAGQDQVVVMIAATCPARDDVLDGSQPVTSTKLSSAVEAIVAVAGR